MRALRRIARLTAVALPLAAVGAALLLSSPSDRDAAPELPVQTVHESAHDAPGEDRPLGADQMAPALPPALLDAPGTPVRAALSTSVASVDDAGSSEDVLASKPMRVPAAPPRARPHVPAGAPSTLVSPAPIEPASVASATEPIAERAEQTQPEPSEQAPIAAPPSQEQRASIQPTRATVFRLDQF